MGTCQDIVHWCDPFARRPNLRSSLASDGFEQGKPFSKLSSCSQSSGLVEFGSQPNFVGIIDQRQPKADRVQGGGQVGEIPYQEQHPHPADGGLTRRAEFPEGPRRVVRRKLPPLRERTAVEVSGGFRARILSQRPGQQQEQQARRVEGDEAQDGGPQEQVVRRQRGQDVAFPDQTRGLHPHRQDQRQPKADRVQGGGQVGEVPHQEQHPRPADGGFARRAREFIRADEARGPADELNRRLHVPGGDEGDQQAGGPEAHEKDDTASCKEKGG